MREKKNVPTGRSRSCAVEATGWLCDAGCAAGYVVRVGFSQAQMIGGARALHAGGCSRVRAAIQSGAYKSVGWAWPPAAAVLSRVRTTEWRRDDDDARTHTRQLWQTGRDEWKRERDGERESEREPVRTRVESARARARDKTRTPCPFCVDVECVCVRIRCVHMRACCVVFFF